MVYLGPVTKILVRGKNRSGRTIFGRPNLVWLDQFWHPKLVWPGQNWSGQARPISVNQIERWTILSTKYGPGGPVYSEIFSYRGIAQVRLISLTINDQKTRERLYSLKNDVTVEVNPFSALKLVLQ